MKSTSDDVLIARYLLQSDFGYFLVPNVMTVRIYRQISPTKRFSMIRQIGLAVAEGLGAVSIRKTVLPGMAIPMLKIRRPNGRLIFNMEIAIRR